MPDAGARPIEGEGNIVIAENKRKSRRGRDSNTEGAAKKWRPRREENEHLNPGRVQTEARLVRGRAR